MVSSSKILTVSYGTFSCTAEGFDDPLAVVKDTTHFFRGVVGEDRFFGAEPPQFDPELASELMRAQITADASDGSLTVRPALAAGAASSGALAAALAAGPARAAEAEVEAESEADLPDDAVIEAAAAEAEARAEAAAEAEAPDEAATADNIAEALAKDAEGSVSEIDETPEETAAAPVSETISEPVTEEAPEAASDETPDQADSFDPQLLADMAADSALPADEDMAPDAGELNVSALLAETPDMDETPASAPAPRSADPVSVAAKLDRIRAVVADSAAPVEAPQDEMVEDLEELEDTAEEPSLDAILGGLDITEDDIAEIAEVAEADTADLEEDSDEAENSIASLMAGLSGVPQDDDTQAETVAEDQPAEDDIAALLEDVAEDDEADDAFAAWDDDADEEDTLAQDDADDWSMEDEAEADETPAPVIEPATSTAPEQPALRPAPLRARVVKVKRAEFEEAVASGQLEEIEDEAEAEDDTPLAKAPEAAGADISTLSAEEEDELARELAAVKAELAGEFDEDDWGDDDEDALEADGEDSLAWDDSDVEDLPEEIAASSAPDAQNVAWGDDDDWDDEDEDDWDDAPAAADAPLRLDNPVSTPDVAWDDSDVEEDTPEAAELPSSTTDSIRAAVAGVRKAVKMSSPARAMLTESKVEDNDTSRILDQTNEELEEPEGNRRRSAIAHLRAAVAATKADKLLGRKSAEQEEEIESYREDLATVVRPRRPQQPAQQRTERPAESAEAARPAPLKLVAEQRVEEPAAPAAAEPAQPVRPRRVNRSRDAAQTPREMPASPPEAPSSGSDFAAYAESVGASELPELLEAAAAYMSFVEGRDQFSRPQLMTTVRLAEEGESSREDRLRSFGQLLREGKIQKTSGGRFTASDRISFKPDRAAG